MALLLTNASVSFERKYVVPLHQELLCRILEALPNSSGEPLITPVEHLERRDASTGRTIPRIARIAELYMLRSVAEQPVSRQRVCPQNILLHKDFVGALRMVNNAITEENRLEDDPAGLRSLQSILSLSSEHLPARLLLGCIPNDQIVAVEVVRLRALINTQLSSASSSRTSEVDAAAQCILNFETLAYLKEWIAVLLTS
ncbi:hypothetical protein MPER_12565 [Moniliophthora perniciosa FA553]|nr:hypothetical protein MPER_12565 [Moniliophthora perniciosa FA553]